MPKTQCRLYKKLHSETEGSPKAVISHLYGGVVASKSVSPLSVYTATPLLSATIDLTFSVVVGPEPEHNNGSSSCDNI